MQGAQAQSQLLTVHQVAKLLQTRESHIYQLVAAGKLPVVRLGRLLRFQEDVVMARLAGDPE
jgi:excisionase family DNA binding protein